MATYEELIAYLKGKGYDFNVDVEEVGPTDVFTVAEQEEQCCEEVDVDDCADDGKVEPWNGWSSDLSNELSNNPEPSPMQLLSRAEQQVGKGNVHLEVKVVGPPGNCGEKITEWTDRLGCCEDPAELIKLSGTTSVQRDHDYTYKINSSSGELPVSWGTLGAGIELSANGNGADVHINECFCNPGVVYAQDTCESVAPWLISLSDGSWSNIADTELTSPFGWFQDGTSGSFFVIGFNDDFTQVSTQSYFEAEYVGTKEEVCGTSFPGINENPIVVPQDSQTFEKCGSSNIWLRLKEGYTNTWVVRYALDSQSTSEFTHECQDSTLVSAVVGTPTLADTSSIHLSWTGGAAPFLLSTHGVEIYLDAARSVTHLSGYNGRSVSVYSADTCGYGWLQVTDACGSSIIIDFKAADGQWVEVYANASGGVYGSGTPDNITIQPYEDGCPFVTEYQKPLAQSLYQPTIEDGKYKISVSITSCGGIIATDYIGSGSPQTYEEVISEYTATCGDYLTDWNAGELPCAGRSLLSQTIGASCLVSSDASPGCYTFFNGPVSNNDDERGGAQGGLYFNVTLSEDGDFLKETYVAVVTLGMTISEWQC